MRTGSYFTCEVCLIMLSSVKNLFRYLPLCRFEQTLRHKHMNLNRIIEYESQVMISSVFLTIYQDTSLPLSLSIKELVVGIPDKMTEVTCHKLVSIQGK